MEAHRAKDSQIHFLLLCWGIPAVYVAICAFLAPTNYGTKDSCWLAGSFIWAFLAPLLCVVVVNIVYFLMILKTIFRVKASLNKAAEESRFVVLKRAFQASCAFFPLMGLTWVFGLLAIIPGASIYFQFLFTICNCFQGLLLFVFHFLLDAKVQKWYHGRKGIFSASSRSSTRKSNNRSSTKTRQRPNITPHHIARTVSTTGSYISMASVNNDYGSFVAMDMENGYGDPVQPKSTGYLEIGIAESLTKVPIVIPVVAGAVKKIESQCSNNEM